MASICDFCMKKSIEIYRKDKGLEVLLEIINVEVIHNDKYIMAKWLSPINKIRTGFHDEGLFFNFITSCALHLTLLIYLIYRKDESFYPEALLEDCKYEVRKVS